MYRQTFEIEGMPQIVVEECRGDLTVRASGQEQVMVKARGLAQDLQAVQEGDRITLTVSGDCALTCPVGSALELKIVRGDLRVSGVGGTLLVGSVLGDAMLRGVGATEMNNLTGDLSAKDVDSDLKVGQVAGDAAVKRVAGHFQAQAIGADLSARGVEGGMDVAVGADAVIGGPFSAGCSYRVSAGSDVSLKLSPDADVRLSLTAGSHIRSTLEDVQLEGDRFQAQAVLGEGQAEIVARAGARITLRAFSPEPEFDDEDVMFPVERDLENLGAEIESRISAAMADMEVRLHERLSRIDSDAIRRRAEQAAERMRRQAEAAAEQARIRAERAERRWERVGGARAREASPAPAARQPAGDEERIKILQLVQDGKISAEEAAVLLEALG